MKSNTIIVTEYTPCYLAEDGRWRPVDPNTLFFYRSQRGAEQHLAIHKQMRAEDPKYFEGVQEYKIMQRTVITVTGEWEDVEPDEEVSE